MFNENMNGKVLYRVRYTDPEDDARYMEVLTEYPWQVENIKELQRNVVVWVSVPVWAPLNNIL